MVKVTEKYRTKKIMKPTEVTESYYVVELSQEEMDTLVIMTGSCCGSSVKSRRKYTEKMWNAFKNFWSGKRDDLGVPLTGSFCADIPKEDTFKVKRDDVNRINWQSGEENLP